MEKGPRKSGNAKTGGFSQKVRAARLEEEQNRLSVIEQRFANAHDLVIVRCLLSDIAFMNVELAEARQIIQRKGIIEEYQNGENQYGLKKSSAVETYDKLVNSRLRCIRQVTDMLPPPTVTPNEPAESPEAELKRFLAGE